MLCAIVQRCHLHIRFMHPLPHPSRMASVFLVPSKDDRRAAHSAQLGAYGHTSTDMIMWGDFSALHGSVKVIWDELRYSRRMRRLDRSSMLLLKVAPC